MGPQARLRRQAAARSTLMTQRLRELVEAESPSQDQAALTRCADLLDGWFGQALGRPAHRPVPDRPHLLWTSPEADVLLLGHFDTVWPIGTLNDWPLTITDGIASGPGTFDMKAGIVQMLTALELASSTEHVGVLLTCDEETGSATSRELIETEAAKVKAVLVCEPSADGGAVKTTRKGAATYQITVTGLAAHAGLEPELGINATTELAHQIIALATLADPEQQTTITPTLVSAGTTSNTVPDHATLTVDVRAWTATELDRVDQAIRTPRPRDHRAGIQVDRNSHRYPLQPQPGPDLLAQVREAATDLGFPPPEGVASAGASDGNLTAALGVPTLDGLGAVGGHPHATNEHADTRTMPDRAALLAALLNRLTG